MKPFPITQNRHRMKNLSRLIPLLVLAPLAHAQEVDIDDASGYVAPLTINLVVSETTGGYAISAAKKESEAARGVTYPDFTTFQTTYQPDTPVSAIINPFGWDAAKGNNYVEKVTTKLTDPEAPVVTAAGSYKVTKTRYTNATLLADLVAAGIIPTATGYRLVAVRFNVAGDSHYDTPTHLTDVNTGYYFFAEMGAKDPSPVYLGAERDDMFGDEKFIAFSRGTTAKSGAYVDVFTGGATGGGYAYTLKSESYSGSTYAEFTFYRPAANEAFYLLGAQGILNWSERYDARRQAMTPGLANGPSLAGTAQGYSHTEEGGYVATGKNPALVGGSVNFGPTVFSESMIKYLNQMPGTMETHSE